MRYCLIDRIRGEVILEPKEFPKGSNGSPTYDYLIKLLMIGDARVGNS